MASLLHNVHVTPAWAPIADLTTAATTGIWVDVALYSGASLLFWKNDAAANTVTLTFNRATAAAGTNSEVFDVLPTTAAKSTLYWKTVASAPILPGVSNAIIGAPGIWVRAAPTSASTYTTVAGSPSFLVAEFNVDDLFTNATTTTGMRWISVDASQAGSAAIGVAVWLLYGKRYSNPLITQS